MKNYLYLFSLSILMLIAFPAISQSPLKVSLKQPYRVIAKIDTNLVSNNTLTTKTDAIKSIEIEQLFRRFNVNEIQSVFRNRYNEAGKLKNINNPYNLSGWYQIIFLSLPHSLGQVLYIL